MCNPICADLPKAPKKSKNEIIVSLSKSKKNIEKVVSITQGIRANTVI